MTKCNKCGETKDIYDGICKCGWNNRYDRQATEEEITHVADKIELALADLDVFSETDITRATEQMESDSIGPRSAKKSIQEIDNMIDMTLGAWSQAKVGYLFCLLHKAIKLIKKSQEEENSRLLKKVVNIADEIYLGLTGKRKV